MMPTIFIRREHRYRIGVLSVVGFVAVIWLWRHLPSWESLTTLGPNPRRASIRQGLQLRDNKFILEGKELRILSGAMHYFRIVPEYWEDRLKRLKAAGLNTVET